MSERQRRLSQEYFICNLMKSRIQNPEIRIRSYQGSVLWMEPILKQGIIMNYANIKERDIANGPGVRVSLFVSGCNHHCKGCFNEVAWDFNYGEPFTEETIDHIIELLKPDYIKGLTILGGEPMEPINQKGILPLVQRVRETYPEKTIWCYTGFTYETDILNNMMNRYPVTRELLPLLDVLVDGKFEIELLDLKLRFRGSSNQRIIDLKKSREKGETVLWENDSVFG